MRTLLHTFESFRAALLKLFFLPLFLTIALAGAQNNTPEKLVAKAIEHAGGWEAGMSTKTVQFRPTKVDFDSD